MNYHSDKYILDKVHEHLEESLNHFSEDNIIGIFYQGSGNYGLDTKFSDVDTKLIVVPSFKDIAMNKSPISTTHVRKNDEHIDFKDIRLYFQTFRKQNINFLEILFTKFYICNIMYSDEWARLINAREQIAHYNEKRAVQTMYGMSLEKYKQLEKDTPSHKEELAKYGYSAKELHHLLRLEEFIYRYTHGTSYEECLQTKAADYLTAVKLGYFNLDFAREAARSSIERITKMVDSFCQKDIEPQKEVEDLLNDVQYNIMKKAVMKELKG